MTYAAEAAREDRAYRTALASLSPRARAAWAEIEETHEWFDGESAIAHATLKRWLASRRGVSGGRR
jgi:hypothetical protein